MRRQKYASNNKIIWNFFKEAVIWGNLPKKKRNKKRGGGIKQNKIVWIPAKTAAFLVARWFIVLTRLDLLNLKSYLKLWRVEVIWELATVPLARYLIRSKKRREEADEMRKSWGGKERGGQRTKDTSEGLVEFVKLLLNFGLHIDCLLPLKTIK